MTLDEYKQQILKTAGEGEDITYGMVWKQLTRRERREIERQVKKGKNPDLRDLF